MSFAGQVGNVPVSSSARVRTVLPGLSKTAEIQAAVDDLNAAGGGMLVLFEGDYVLSSAVNWKSNVSVTSHEGDSRRAKLKPAAGWTGGVDDPANALIKASLATGSSSTLTAAVRKGKTSFTVASVPGDWAAGDYLRVQGHNPSNDQSYGDSDGSAVSLTSIVQIFSLPGGGVVNTVDPLPVYHASGLTVTKVTPVRDVVFRGLDFEGPTGGNLASGLFLQGVQRAEVVSCAGAGLSRAIVEVREGAENVNVQGVFRRGETNGIVWVDGAHRGSISGIECDPRGTRFHARAGAVPRGAVWFRNRPTDWRISDSTISRMCVGLNFWGSHNLQVDDVQMFDLDSQECADRSEVLGTPETLSKLLAVGLNTGSSNVPVYAENHANMSVSGVSVINCRHHQQETGANGGCSMYLANLLDFRFEDCAVFADGDEPPVPFGLYIDDCVRGEIVGTRFRGVTYCYRFRNQGLGQGWIRGGSYESNAGVPVSEDFVIQFDYTAPGGGPTKLRFQGIVQSNFANKVGFLSGFSTFADLGVEWHDCDFGQESSFAVAAVNDSGVTLNPGDHVTWKQPGSPDGLRKVLRGSAAGILSAVCVLGGANGSWILVAPLPNRHNWVLCTTSAVKLGDLIVGSATAGQFETNNAPANAFHVVGRALIDKASGSTGLVKIGPV